MDILKGGNELEALKLAWDSRQLMDLERYCPAPSARAPPKVHEHEQEQQRQQQQKLYSRDENAEFQEDTS